MAEIKSFDELFSNIREALDQPLTVNWYKSPTNWVGVFNTSYNEYNIVISKEDYDIWKYKFFIKNNGELSTKLTSKKYKYMLYETSFGDNDINPTLYVLYKKLTPDELYSVIKKVTDEIGI